MKKINPDILPKIMFFFSLFCLVFGWGYAVEKYNVFPGELLKQAKLYTTELLIQLKGEKHWYYQPTQYTQNVPILEPDAVEPGPTLLTGVGADGNLFVHIVDMQGEIIHQWNIDWFNIWPDADHIPEDVVPKSRPGTHLHGIVIMPNGDIIFNFSGMGLMRMDVCGNVVWKLAELTHHSVHMDDDGNLWVPCYDYYYDHAHKKYPYLDPKFRVSKLLHVSTDGEILDEISVLDIFHQNDLDSYWVLTSKARWDVKGSGDLDHLNDIEPFPDSMQEGVFKHGDLMISLRNINTIVVFDPKTLEIRYFRTGGWTRQHDPDFVDGNTISVYDNNVIRRNKKQRQQSRIVLCDARSNKTSVRYTGSPEHPFYSAEMGKHQWLDNGNILITEPAYGRAFEITPQDSLVWQYVNILGDGYTAIIEEATRISPRYTREFFEQQIAKCNK